MNVREVLKGLLNLVGSPGLENKEMECSCTIDDLVPCHEDPCLCCVIESKDEPGIPTAKILKFPNGG